MKENKFLTFILLTLGALIAAFSLRTFLIPNTILDGGVVGISIILNKQFAIPIGLLVCTINIPFIYVGYKRLGKTFLIRTLYTMIVFSILLELLEFIKPLTEEMLLATVFGGAILGIGVGLVIRIGGAIDGTEAVAIVLSKKFNLGVGQIVLMFNLVIYTIAGTLFGLDRALFSILTYFITSKVVDIVSSGLEQTKAALIITDKGTDLAKAIYRQLGRTTTILNGQGFISGEKEVLYCVLTRIEIFELKRIARDLDSSAFISIIDVTDLIGDHIKSSTRKRIKEKTID